jgi:hypothetical protein
MSAINSRSRSPHGLRYRCGRGARALRKGSSTGVCPQVTTCRDPRTACPGLIGTTWPLTSQSNRCRSAASRCLTEGAANSRVDRRLVQRRGQRCGHVFRGATARVARPALLEAGVQSRLAAVRCVFALGLGHLAFWRVSGYISPPPQIINMIIDDSRKLDSEPTLFAP